MGKTMRQEDSDDEGVVEINGEEIVTKNPVVKKTRLDSGKAKVSEVERPSPDSNEVDGPVTTVPPDPGDSGTWPSTFKEEDIKGLVEKSGRLSPDVVPDYEGYAFAFKRGWDVNSLIRGILVPQETPESIRRKGFGFLKDYRITCNKANSSKLEERSQGIQQDCYVKIYNFKAQNTNAVRILSGESGSGKTVEAIVSVCPDAADLRFFCIASDIELDLTNGNDRDEECVNGLVKAMGACYNYIDNRKCDFLANLKGAASTTGKELTVGIVVDEAGGHHQLVRALCSVAGSLRGRLGLKENVTVRMAVAGTGVLSGNLPPGSHPDTFVATVLHISETTYWDHIVKTEKVPQALISRIAEHPRASGAICNPRFARLLLREIQTALCFDSLAMGSDTVLTSLVNTWLANTANHFKSRNGLCRVDTKSLLHVVGSALHLSLFSNTPPPPIEASSEGVDPVASQYSDFIVKYGMVVDNAKWVTTYNGDTHDLWATSNPKCLTSPDKPFSLVAPKGGRFTLSIAHSSIFMLLLGLVPDRSSLSGESLESCVASLLPLLISAFRTRTIGAMLTAVGVRCDDSSVIPNDLKTIKSVQYHKQKSGILGTAVDETNYASDSAYVVVNSPKYPFADIVVLIPNTVMLLIQCKDYSYQLQSQTIKDELAKMCHPSYKSNKKAKVAKKALIAHFKIPKVMYVFVGSNANMIDGSVDSVTSDSCPHTVYFGGLSGAKEPLSSVIAFDKSKPNGCLSRDVGALGEVLSIHTVS